MAESCTSQKLVPTVRSVSPPRCRSVQRRLPCGSDAFSGEAPVASDRRGDFEPSRSGVTPAHESGTDDKDIGRRKQGSCGEQAAGGVVKMGHSAVSCGYLVSG
jgi:hypothetical protein